MYTQFCFFLLIFRFFLNIIIKNILNNIFSFSFVNIVQVIN